MTQSNRRKWIALLLLCMVQFMVVLDIAIVNVALPSIQTDLGFSQENLQWVISAYSLVFGGFSGEALRFRVEDTGAKLLVTTDGQFRRGAAVPVKANADHAVSGENQVEHVLVVRRTGDRTPASSA